MSRSVTRMALFGLLLAVVWLSTFHRPLGADGGYRVALPLLQRAVLPLESYRVLLTSDRDGDFDIYTARSDGSNVVALTDNSNPDRGAVPSPDGMRIIYSRVVTSPTHELLRMDADGSDPALLVSHTSGFTPYGWSPDSRWIYYALSGTLYVVAADGGTALPVLGVGDEFESWSPDSRYLLFGRDVDGVRQIFRANPDGSGVVQLTEANIDANGVWWLPDRASFLTTLYDSATLGADVLLVTITGEEHPYFETSEYEAVYTLSPDGNWLVLRSTPGGTALSLRHLDGSGERFDFENSCAGTVAQMACMMGVPAWSPDSAQLMFPMVELITPTLNPVSIYRIVMDGGTGAPVRERYLGGADAPRFAPDSSALMYIKTHSDAAHSYYPVLRDLETNAEIPFGVQGEHTEFYGWVR